MSLIFYYYKLNWEPSPIDFFLWDSVDYNFTSYYVFCLYLVLNETNRLKDATVFNIVLTVKRYGNWRMCLMYKSFFFKTLKQKKA